MHLYNLIKRPPCLRSLEEPLNVAADMLETCVRHGGKILVCGNGGSAADAEHIVGELMKGFLLPRPLPYSLQEQLLLASNSYMSPEKLQQPIPAISLASGVSLPTAFANDVDAEYVFAQQVLGLGKKGDVLWGISTSGNSSNVVYALSVARALGIKTLGFTGRDGGRMAELCDVELRVPAQHTPEIQELHLPLYHALCAELESRIFGKI